MSWEEAIKEWRKQGFEVMGYDGGWVFLRKTDVPSSEVFPVGETSLARWIQELKEN